MLAFAASTAAFSVMPIQSVKSLNPCTTEPTTSPTTSNAALKNGTRLIKLSMFITTKAMTPPIKKIGFVNNALPSAPKPLVKEPRPFDASPNFRLLMFPASAFTD